ncbi:MAG: IPT/TIG domain-containing protein [Nitriliruptor sp.]
MPDHRTNPPRRRTTRSRVGSLLLSGALIAAVSTFGASPAAAAPGDAEATGVSVDLGLALGGEQIIDENLVLADVVAPAGGGTETETLIPLVIDEEQFELRAEVIEASATRATDGSDAYAEIGDVLLRIGDTELLAADVLTAEAVCPATGDTTADAEIVGLSLGGTPVAEADLPTTTDVPVEFDIPEVLDADARVQLRQVETTTADSAHATALVADIDLEVVLADEDVLKIDLGEIVLADAQCERPTDGTDADGTDADGSDDGTDGLPGLPGTDDGDDGTDADGSDDGTDGTDGADDGTDDDGLELPAPGDDDGDDAGPSADSLNPDNGPVDGGTAVTIDGDGLDTAESVTIDGDAVDFEANGDGDQLTFVTPPGDAAGPVDVVVTFEDGTTDTLQFTYTDDTAVLGGDADNDGAADNGDGTDVGGATASALPVTGSQEVPAGAALALLLLTGGLWLLAYRGRPVATS